jgi:Photoprotection regulator fluorescence recovery protein
MMQVSDADWTKTEREIAQEAFNKAYQREIDALLQEVREKASSIAQLDDLWQLHNFLSARRHEIDGKYDYRYSVLVFVFAQLLKEGWLHLSELEGLGSEKLTKMSALARM